MNRGNRLLIGGMVLAATVLLSARGLAGTKDELLDNAGFERGDVSWRYWGDGDVKEEYYGLKAVDGTFFLRLWLRSGWYQDVAVKKGEMYDVTAFATTASKDGLWGDAYGEVKVEWRNKGNDQDTEVGESTSVKFDLAGKQDKTLVADEWMEIELPGVVAPTHATHARVLMTIWCSDDKGGGCVLFDDVRVRKVSP